MLRASLPSPFILLLTLLAMSGCWSENAAFETTTWADDGTGFAFVEHTFEQRSCCPSAIIGGLPTKNHRFQIFTANLDGSGAKAVSPVFDNATTNELRYMKSAGYILFSRSTSNSGGGFNLRYEKLDLASGSIKTVADYDVNYANNDCVSVNVFPSPDGAVFASVEQPSDCYELSAKLVFRDAFTLATLSSLDLTFTGALIEPQYQRSLDYAWHPDGTFVVWNHTTDDPAYKVTPAGMSTPITPPTCSYPKTSSSIFGPNGEMAAYLGHAVDIYEADPNMAYPCSGTN